MHNSFKLNGATFKNPLELIEFSKAISEDLFLFLSFWFDQRSTITVDTSGSTGTPKAIQIKKEFMKNSANATGVFFGLAADTKALCCLPVKYIAGKMMVVRALTLGWALDVVAPTSKPLDATCKTYDFCAMTPMQVKASLCDLHLVKKLLIGGGVVSESLQSDLQSISTQCFASYGMTETISHVAVKKLNFLRSESGNYQLLPNVKIHQDKRNCLVIDAPLLSDEPITTNDIVTIYTDTAFEWLGRFDNVINSGGIKLHPEQIEKQLSKIIHQRFFVAGLPDEVLGEKLVLVVEGKEQSIELSSLNLSKFEIPKQTFFIEKFIETETKKIQRQKTLDLVGF